MSERHRAKKRFGQHFLTSGSIADRIVDAADPGPSDDVLEIGPGTGILTRRLVARAGSVTAVEIDRDLASRLETEFGSVATFRLVMGDILDIDLAELFRDRTGPVSVISNIPYNISTPIIEHLTRHRQVVARALLMVQREVAARLCSPPGSRNYGLTTLNLALHATCSRIMDVRPGSFDPPPAVMSSVIRIEYRPGGRIPVGDEALFRALTGAVFRQRRKMLSNTLVPFMRARGLDTDTARDIIASCGISVTARPETVPPETFAAITDALLGAAPAQTGEEGMLT